MSDRRPVVALSGGVGGAKLAVGLLNVLTPDTLHIVANTGDDFEHLGFHISPDIDTLLYALSGRDNREQGWGRRDETWHFMAALEEVGGETWFRLGDRDLAVHVERTRRLSLGETLSSITADFAARFGIAASILPMSDAAVRTRLNTSHGWMDFQPWFVGQKAEPAVRGIRFDGSDQASLPIVVRSLLENPDLRAVIICPSNPLISIDPILAVADMRALLERCSAPVIAVSPLIEGRAVKGPTAKMLRDLGIEPGVAAIAAHYGNLIDGVVLDEADAADVENLNGLPTMSASTLMLTLDDRRRVATASLALADRVAGGHA
jgi:LPPG:FO 2-phospho-L-lactate transferase